MQTTKIVFIISLLFGALLLYVVNAQAVTEEARRHMVRGQAAVEMARTPEDYEAAIQEFQTAARLAPTWSAPYYKLGMAQEKAGKFREAVVSLKRYLLLAPNAPDAAKVKERIYKLEYKAERENILTIADIVDVLVSFGKEETWEIVKRGAYDENNNFDTCEGCGYIYQYAFITRVGNDSIRVPRMIVHTSGGVFRVVEQESYNIIKIEGPVVKFAMQNSYVGYPIPPGQIAITPYSEIEVVSKTYVKSRHKSTLRTGWIFVAEYRKR